MSAELSDIESISESNKSSEDSVVELRWESEENWLAFFGKNGRLFI
jgi:hypothetical protein